MRLVLLEYCYFLVAFTILQIESESNDCPVISVCPDGCTSVTDRTGCVNCFCDISKLDEECPDLNLCPEHCAVESNGKCPKCICAKIDKPVCPDNITCPVGCQRTQDTLGCPKCDCSNHTQSNSSSMKRDCPLQCNVTHSRCVDGQCICEEGYEKDAISDTCYPLPRIGEKCRVNGTVYRCYGPGVQPYCNTEGVCVCEAYHQPNPDRTGCVLKARYLDDNCTSHSDCLTAYSYCRRGLCQCLEGFISSNNKCYPKEHNCPEGKVFNSDGSVRQCEYRFGSYDTCPTGSSCFVQLRTMTINGSNIGHCCVNKVDSIDPLCPVGQSLVNATCPHSKHSSPDHEKSPNAPNRLCPSSTHECVRHPLVKTSSAVCCPLPCLQGSKFFAYDGICYPYVRIGEKCDIQAQCIGGSRCVEIEGEKRCKCPLRFTQIFQSYCKPPVYEDAEPVLPFGTGLRGRKPQSIKEKGWHGLLGHRCEQNSDCITAYAYCNESGICSCSSGFVAQGKTLCQAHDYRCPMGQPLKRGQTVLTCSYDSPDGTIGNGNHTCPPSYFCYLYPDTKTINGNAIGHCCKEPTDPDHRSQVDIVCPLGDPSLSGHCPRVGRAARDLQAKPDRIRGCPPNTHVCYFHYINPTDQPCCPKPCPHSPNHFAADGTCYEYTYTGQPCAIDAQCAVGRCRQSFGGGRTCQ